MTTKQQFSISLPAEMAEIVQNKVRSGSHTSPSDVMRDGLLALLERDDAVERWLCEDVIAGHAEYLADPTKGVPAGDVLARIKSRRDGAKT